jgi:hypothetical protein
MNSLNWGKSFAESLPSANTFSVTWYLQVTTARAVDDVADLVDQ